MGGCGESVFVCVCVCVTGGGWLPVQMHACKSSLLSVNALLGGELIESTGNVFDLTEQLPLEFLSLGQNQSQFYLSQGRNMLSHG